MEIQRVLILDFLELPAPVQNEVRQWLGFHNDVILPVRSSLWEFSDIVSEAFTEKNLRLTHDHYLEKKLTQETNFYEWCINNYHQFDLYLIEHYKNKLKHLDRVFVEILW